MKKLFNRIKTLYTRKHTKIDLREKCIEEYGEEFGEIYDNMCQGIPIGGFIETAAVIHAIEDVKKNMKEGIRWFKSKNREVI